MIIASERDIFDLSGPLHLTSIEWENPHHRRSIVASLVQGVYVLERDRQEKRTDHEALAPPWWEFFHFKLLRNLVDDADYSIFGAIYEFEPSASQHNHSLVQSMNSSPRYVIAFRGTLTMPGSFSRDIELDLHFLQQGLHRTSRFEIAIQAVRNMVAVFGDANVWLAGHSLGSAMAMLAGKTMAKNGTFLNSFLFNPPFFSAPIETIKYEKIKHGIRITTSVITAGLTIAMKASNMNGLTENPFAGLSAWIPCLFVNPGDYICSEYIGYFEHRDKMEEIGAGAIERLATQNSIGGLLLKVMGSESDPMHLIPSANLTINLTPSKDLKEAHGIHQWWKDNMQLKSKLYKYR